ncbi:hypothetical protein PENSPDRAFT_758744 [Peniophora sp. CONT]|nr:hypothetical protein PENSPDRAFT_758744 [Peniophora sp. CONT]
MARPRESLLNEFDPLAVGMATPSTSSPSAPAPRESGEFSSSDKENSSPMTSRGSKSGALTMTKFFDRTYARHKAPPKPLPKGALIDYDLSMMSDDSMDASTDGDDGNDIDEEEDAENAGERQSPVAVTPRRRVLGDIRFEQAASSPVGLLDATPLGFRAIPAQYYSSSLSPAASIATGNQRSDAASLPTSPTTPPSINVLPPDVAVSSLSSAQQSHSSPGLTRRPSLDLTASFNMSMNLRDNSFDILNDRISFVGCDSMLSNEDFDVDLHISSFAANTEEPPTTEDESDRGGLADESDSASEADFRGSLTERLADVHLDEDNESEGEGENAPCRANLAALATPKPQTVSSAPKAPHVSKHYTGPVQTRLAPALPDGQARLLARGHIVPPPAASAELTTTNATIDVPKPSVAALRVVKKPQLARRASLAPASRVSTPSSSATSRSGTPSGQDTRVPSPATALPTRAPSVLAARPRVFVAPSQVNASTNKVAASAPARPRTSVAPASTTGVLRPTKASLLKGPAAARVPAARPSAASTATSSKLQRAPTTTAARVPVKPAASIAQPAKTSGLRAPSRFGAPTASSAAKKPVASGTGTGQPVRDVAKILRGPAPKRA